MGFEIPKINMFQQPVAQIGAVGARGPQAAGGSHKTAGGQTPYDAEMADFYGFLKNCNPAQPNVLNNDSNAGPIVTFAYLA